MPQLPQSYRTYRLTQPGALNGDNLKLQETQVPHLKATEVLLKVHAVSLNYRDIQIAEGWYATETQPNLVPCSDMSGEVAAVGSEVTKWKPGQRVCVSFALDHLFGDSSPEILASHLGGAKQDGVLSEYKVVPQHSLVEIPNYLSYEEASTLPCAAVTAYNSLLGYKPLKGGDYVLVQGTGGVSIFALQIAVASGATVIATSSSDEKLKVAKDLGAQHLINYSANPKWDEKVLEITGGRGVDHIIEVGGAATLHKSLRSLRIGGNIYIIGYVGKDSPEEPMDNFYLKLIPKAANLHGIQIGSVAQFEDMNRLFSAKSIRPVVDKVFSFEESLAAYEYLKSQKHVGKVVIKVAH